MSGFHAVATEPEGIAASLRERFDSGEISAMMGFRLSVLPWWYSSVMPRGNPSPKLAITVDPDVHAGVVAAAAAEGVSVSAWMTEAARGALRVREGLAAVGEWEAEHGPLTDEELAAARRRVAGPGAERRSA